MFWMRFWSLRFLPVSLAIIMSASYIGCEWNLVNRFLGDSSIFLIYRLLFESI
jgi:hypothetical protein